MPGMLMGSEEYKCKNYQKALEETFVELDYLLLSDEGHEKMRKIVLDMKIAIRGPGATLDMQELREINSLAFQAGCTSCVCLITPDTIYCSNSGDSRAVLATKAGKVIELSHDHKPDNDGELFRVKAAGGFVEEGRV
jgi:serine/threonine protein phosphatase PrpC